MFSSSSSSANSLQKSIVIQFNLISFYLIVSIIYYNSPSEYLVSFSPSVIKKIRFLYFFVPTNLHIISIPTIMPSRISPLIYGVDSAFRFYTCLKKSRSICPSCFSVTTLIYSCPPISSFKLFDVSLAPNKTIPKSCLGLWSNYIKIKFKIIKQL